MKTPLFLKIIILLLSINFFLILGYRLGENDTRAIVEKVILGNEISYKKKINKLENKIYALINNRGILLSIKKASFDKGMIISHLVNLKNERVIQYEFEGKTILLREAVIDNDCKINQWVYDIEAAITNPIKPPDDFVYFEDYEENDTFPYPTFVKNKFNSFDNFYISTNKIKMFWDSDSNIMYTSSVSLNSYFNYLNYRNPKPVLLNIVCNVVNYGENNYQDVLKTKEKLKRISDTLKLPDYYESN